MEILATAGVRIDPAFKDHKSWSFDSHVTPRLRACDTARGM
jgi:hypothetical protein